MLTVGLGSDVEAWRRWGTTDGASSEEGQGATVRQREGSVPTGRRRDADVGVVLWRVVQARCKVSAAGGGEEDGGRAALTSPHRLRSPLCSHTPAERRKSFQLFEINIVLCCSHIVLPYSNALIVN